MKLNISFLIITLLLVQSCKNQTIPTTDTSNIKPLNLETQLTTIAFGSCNKESSAQPMWSVINSHEPDLWIWMGDNIYGDSDDTAVLAHKYAIQNQQADYQTLRQQTPIIGIWDDHDYGVNDGDRNFPMKAESKALMYDFLDVPENHASRNREGAYQSYTFGKDGKKVKILLLDTRYFREELTPNPGGQPRYIQNDTGSILGESQWQWLEEELTNSDAQVHIIGGGIQMIAKDHWFEKWANFPVARQRFFDLLADKQPSNLLLISGDRHIAELSMMADTVNQSKFYDFTSSGLTHSYEAAKDEVNEYRISSLVPHKNFGLINIDWTQSPAKVSIECRGLEDELFFEEALEF